jgi:hypothetical protein
MRFHGWLIPLLLMTVVGCGGGNGTIEAPELVPISGKVLLDGKPLAAAQVFFLPKATTGGQVCYASTAEDGSFALKYVNGDEGCPRGEFVMQVSKLLTPDGKPIPEGQTAADVAAVDIIPLRYKDPDAPMNSVTITGPKSDFQIALKSR